MNSSLTLSIDSGITFMRRLSMVAVAVLLTACAASYQPPQGKDVARLRILSQQTEWSKGVKSVIYPTGGCEAPMELGFFGGIARLGAQEKPLGIPGGAELDARTFIERLIPAGRRDLITMKLGISADSQTCVVTFSFEPVVGGDYEARMHWQADRCYVSLNKVGSQDGTATYTREPSVRREQTCIRGT
ncbi:hypothetical protein DBV14_24805 [Variovorax sp. KBW07]|uniref:hypothetical protein n=1 Tax=Variovorax sp. KBW07 TaxID=2153358 RepID=UPI000F562E0E|nr:hypothetical protein [Variovorax sp. KBW07]RQO44293.1 hypothetical protein DBV14_24805 [Variovorax sp. KBW07]